MIEIPEIDHSFEHVPNRSGWLQPVRKVIVDATAACPDGFVYEPVKPIIRCNCGAYVGLKLHHVHADGTVTASFYHKRGTNYQIGESPEGCEWHVFLKLLGYHGGDFPGEVIP